MSAAASWSGASSAMWWSLGMATPRRSRAHGRHTARTSPYSACMSSAMDQATRVGQARYLPAALSASSAARSTPRPAR